jgi:hypothetical protein
MSVASQELINSEDNQVTKIEGILVRNGISTANADDQNNVHTLTALTANTNRVFDKHDDSLNSPIDSAETRQETSWLPPTWNQQPTTGNKTTVY